MYCYYQTRNVHTELYWLHAICILVRVTDLTILGAVHIAHIQ